MVLSFQAMSSKRLPVWKSRSLLRRTFPLISEFPYIIIITRPRDTEPKIVIGEDLDHSSTIFSRVVTPGYKPFGHRRKRDERSKLNDR